MVKNQIEARGITDQKTLAAMRKVPRHLFVSEALMDQAYADHPLPIGEQQTISQPYIVAHMTEALQLKPDDRVLEVGTGSGYQAASLGELAAEVHTIERHPELADTAQQHLVDLGYQNIHVHVGDGTLGYPAAAPYDRIIAAASAPKVPDPLLQQLADGGRLVLPVGSRFSQHLEVWTRQGEKFKKSNSIPVVFVPLIGEAGWDGDDPD